MVIQYGSLLLISDNSFPFLSSSSFFTPLFLVRFVEKPAGKYSVVECFPSLIAVCKSVFRRVIDRLSGLSVASWRVHFIILPVDNLLQM